MNMIIDNWYIIVAAIAVIVAIIFALVKWFNLPTATQVANLKEWLKFGVTEAEKALGAKTGQLKLRMVYDMAVAKFPWLTIVSFDTFSGWVDESLDWLETQLASNAATFNYVEGGKE